MKKEERIKKTREDKLIEYKAKKLVKKSGTGAVIYMPKELINKEVEVRFPPK